jgi:hypothetical protein
MIKKTKIFSLILLFFVSTTGLPVFSHYCEMMGKSSLSDCEECNLEKDEIFSCCIEEISDIVTEISASESTCCIENFMYKKIEDDYSYSSNLKPITSNVVSTLSPLALESEKEETKSQNNNYNLPSPKFGKQLLQTIHQLKIDLPIC